jgi:hypothetical protein
MKSPLLLVIGLGIILISYTVLINRDESADLQLAGVWTYGGGEFTIDPHFRLPSNFTMTPEKMYLAYGKYCKGPYFCDYFVDKRFYYIVPNWNFIVHFPWQTVPSSAKVIVDGTTGELIYRRVDRGD